MCVCVFIGVYGASVYVNCPFIFDFVSQIHKLITQTMLVRVEDKNNNNKHLLPFYEPNLEKISTKKRKEEIKK